MPAVIVSGSPTESLFGYGPSNFRNEIPMLTHDQLHNLKNLRVECYDDGVWIVRLNRPHKRNALDLATIDELVDLFTSAPRLGAAAIVLTGEGNHFCAGLDLVNTTKKTAVLRVSCMSACVGTRRSTKWNTEAFR